MTEKSLLSDYEQLRKAVILYRENHTLLETAELFSKTPKTIVSWCKQYQEKGTLSKAPRGGKTHCIVDEQGERFILETVEQENDLSLRKIQHRYSEQFGIRIGQSTVDDYLRKHQITLKKKFLRPQAKRVSGAAQARRIYLENKDHSRARPMFS